MCFSHVGAGFKAKPQIMCFLLLKIKNNFGKAFREPDIKGGDFYPDAS